MKLLFRKKKHKKKEQAGELQGNAKIGAEGTADKVSKPRRNKHIDKKIQDFVKIFKKNTQSADKNIYSKVNNRNRLNELMAKIFSNRGILIIVLVVVVLLFMTCSKQEKPKVENAEIENTVTELDGEMIEKTETVFTEDNKDPMTDTTWEVLQETRKILADSNEAVKNYNTDVAVTPSKDTEDLIADVDDALARVKLINPNVMTEEEALKVIDEMDGLLDELAACIDNAVPTAVDYDNICAVLSGSMWLDDSLNMYGFESDGSTLYLVDNAKNEQFEGTYQVEVSANNNIFIKLKVSDIDVEAVVSSCNSQMIEFTDINTKKTTVLSHVDY